MNWVKIASKFPNNINGKSWIKLSPIRPIKYEFHESLRKRSILPNPILLSKFETAGNKSKRHIH